jgi:hypothetical protein
VAGAWPELFTDVKASTAIVTDAAAASAMTWFFTDTFSYALDTACSKASFAICASLDETPGLVL